MVFIIFFILKSVKLIAKEAFSEKSLFRNLFLSTVNRKGVVKEMVKRTLRLTESVAFELDNLVTENNCDLETLILTNLSKAYNRFGFAREDCIRRNECPSCFRRRCNCPEYRCDPAIDADGIPY